MSDPASPRSDTAVQAGSAAADTVLFDGFCVLCSRWYRFVTARDRNHRFRFVAVQTPEGRTLAERFGVDPDNPGTFILLRGDRAYFRSDAALRILAELPRWGWTIVFRALPTALRDALYNVIARNRYRWFGRLDTCTIPEADRSKSPS
jgi:predicted DCC family thiol-disulfide oxidoreductase YuxK